MYIIQCSALSLYNYRALCLPEIIYIHVYNTSILSLEFIKSKSHLVAQTFEKWKSSLIRRIKYPIQNLTKSIRIAQVVVVMQPTTQPLTTYENVRDDISDICSALSLIQLPSVKIESSGERTIGMTK